MSSEPSLGVTRGYKVGAISLLCRDPFDRPVVVIRQLGRIVEMSVVHIAVVSSSFVVHAYLHSLSVQDGPEGGPAATKLSAPA